MASDNSQPTRATPTDQVVHPEPVVANLGPMGFYLWAQDFYDCRQSFTPREKFSTLPYFLLCRCIELALKSQLLHQGTRRQVKDDHGHSLTSCYEALAADKRILEAPELAAVGQVDVIYRKKGLEYLTIVDYEFPMNLKGRPKLPDLEVLNTVAAKILAAARHQVGLRKLEA